MVALCLLERPVQREAQRGLQPPLPRRRLALLQDLRRAGEASLPGERNPQAVDRRHQDVLHLRVLVAAAVDVDGQRDRSPAGVRCDADGPADGEEQARLADPRRADEPEGAALHRGQPVRELPDERRPADVDRLGGRECGVERVVGRAPGGSRHGGHAAGLELTRDLGGDGRQLRVRALAAAPPDGVALGADLQLRQPGHLLPRAVAGHDRHDEEPLPPAPRQQRGHLLLPDERRGEEVAADEQDGRCGPVHGRGDLLPPLRPHGDLVVAPDVGRQPLPEHVEVTHEGVLVRGVLVAVADEDGRRRHGPLQYPSSSASRAMTRRSRP